MGATSNDRMAVLADLAGLAETCAPVKITIGSKFQAHFIVIHEAPPRVVSLVVEKYTLVSMTADGLYIPTGV